MSVLGVAVHRQGQQYGTYLVVDVLPDRAEFSRLTAQYSTFQSTCIVQDPHGQWFSVNRQASAVNGWGIPFIVDHNTRQSWDFVPAGVCIREELDV